MINGLVHKQLDSLFLDAKGIKCIKCTLVQHCIERNLFDCQNQILVHGVNGILREGAKNYSLNKLNFVLAIITILYHCPAALFLLPFQLLQEQSFSEIQRLLALSHCSSIDSKNPDPKINYTAYSIFNNEMGHFILIPILTNMNNLQQNPKVENLSELTCGYIIGHNI